jgi:hypothetical protein
MPSWKISVEASRGLFMSKESDTKKLLQYRHNIENRIVLLEEEINDLKKAIDFIDRFIVTQGFKRPTPPTDYQKPLQYETLSADEEGTSITSKNGTVLGKMKIEENDLLFIPLPEFNFSETIPPFKSFLLERVLDNMRSTDQQRAANNEMENDEVLEYEVEIIEGRIISIKIRNYGGDRRLREINSSLRWTFDKMFDKLKQG